MNFLTKAYLVYHIIRWRLFWSKRDTRHVYNAPDNPKFMSARDAVGLIKDGAVIATSGLAGNQRQAIMYWAIQEMFRETGHPNNLTLVCTGGQGGRGRIPGTMEEIGIEGLTQCLIAGHLETYKAQLRLAEQGKMKIHCIPQGTLTMLLDAQGRGEDSLLTSTGVGTFIDPRVGCGSTIAAPESEQLVTVEGDKLRYRLPKIDVAMFSAPAADTKGNLYLANASLVAETFEIIRAARLNGGRVIASVGCIETEDPATVSVPASDIDAVVHNPRAEQTSTIQHRRYWPMLTTHSDMPIEEGIQRTRHVNHLLGITPRRTPVDNAIARLAAFTFVEHAHKGMLINIGVGLPEEVCRVLFEAGALKDVTMFTESGVIGGLPAPGIFFGAAVCPEKMVSSAQAFKMAYEKLDMAILGVAEADGAGNVNVSRRGRKVSDYIGPGGFIDITTAAKTVLFVSAWMTGAQIEVKEGAIRIIKPGRPKFVKDVSEITFCGPKALEMGKKVLFVTTVGVFELTQDGIKLMRVMPGVDIQRDIINGCEMNVILPPGGSVPVADAAVLSSQKITLAVADHAHRMATL